MSENSYVSRNYLFQKTLFTLTLIFIATVFSTSASASTFNTCKEITTSGYHNLTSDISDSTDGACINVTTSDVILRGQGYTVNGTNHGNRTGLVRVGSNSGTLTNITVKNLTVIKSGNLGQGSGLKAGLYVQGVKNSDFEDINASFSNYNFYFGDNQESQYLNNSVIKNVTSEGSDNGELFMYGKSNDIKNSNFTADSGSNAVDVNGAGSNLIKNVTVKGSNRGIVLGTSNNDVKNSLVKNSNEEALLITSSSGPNTIYNNVFKSNSQGQLVRVSDNGVNMTLNTFKSGGQVEFNSDNSIFNDNEIINADNKGIQLQANNNVSIDNLTVYNSGGNGVDLSGSDIDLTNSNITSNNGDGINFETGLKNSIIENITLNNNTGTGIQIPRDTQPADEHSDISIENITAKNNGRAFQNKDGNHPNITVTNMTLETGKTVSFQSGNFTLKASSFTGTIRSELNEIGNYINITNTSKNAWAQINISYSDSEVSSVPEGDIRIYDYNTSKGNFEKVKTDFGGVNQAKNEVYANITSFSRFGVFDHKYEIESCQKIDSGNSYRVESDILNSDAAPCLNLTVGDVEIKGQGHLIEGNGTNPLDSYDGIHAKGSNRDNISIYNLTTSKWETGVQIDDAGIDNVTLEDVEALNNAENGLNAGINSNLTIIGGNYSNNQYNGIKTGTLVNLTVKNVEASYNGFKGLDYYPNNNNTLTVYNSTFIKNGNEGLELTAFGSSVQTEANITENTVYKNDEHGIFLSYAGDSLIKSNNITANNAVGNGKYSGLYLNNSENTEINSNHISDNTEFGLFVDYSNDTVIQNNDVVSNDQNSETAAGISIGYTSSSTSADLINITVEDNNVSENAGYGIYAIAKNSSYINNTVLRNGHIASKYGIYLSDGDNLNVSQNTLKRNYGSAIYLSKTNNTYAANNYINSSNNASAGGVSFFEISYSDFIDNEIYNKDGDGLTVNSGVNHTVIKKNIIKTMKEAFYFYSGDADINNNNTLINNSAIGSDSFVEYDNLTGTRINRDKIEELKVFTGIKVNLSGKNFNLSDNSSNVPTLPGQNFALATFKAENKSSNSWMQLNISYADSKAQGLNESDLSLYHYNQSGSQWEEVSEAGVDSADNRVYGNVTEFSPIAVYGEGQPDISVSPTSHDFGSVTEGNSKTKVFKITNNGKTNLSLSDASITGGDSSEYSITGNKDGIPSGDNVTTSGNYKIEVKFSPSSDSSYNDADLSIDSNDPDESTKKIDLDGDGTSSSSNSGGGSSGGSSGGGGGGASSGSSSGPTSVSQAFLNAAAGSTKVVDIDQANRDALGVRRVSVTLSGSQDLFEVTIKQQNGKPSDVSEPSGKAYNYMDISADISDDEISSAKIDFEVNKSWINDNNIDLNSVRLNRYSDGSWESLETSQKGEENSVYLFEASAPGFSIFAVTGEQKQQEDGDENQTSTGGEDDAGGSQATGTANQTQQGNQTDSSPRRDSSDSLVGTLLLVLVFLAVVGVSMAAFVKREEIQEYAEELLEDFRGEEEEDEFEEYSFK